MHKRLWLRQANQRIDGVLRCLVTLRQALLWITFSDSGSCNQHCSAICRPTVIVRVVDHLLHRLIIYNLHPVASSELFHPWWQPSLPALLNTTSGKHMVSFISQHGHKKGALTAKRKPEMNGKSALNAEYWLCSNAMFSFLITLHSSSLMTACLVHLNTITWKEEKYSVYSIIEKYPYIWEAGTWECSYFSLLNDLNINCCWLIFFWKK